MVIHLEIQESCPYSGAEPKDLRTEFYRTPYENRTAFLHIKSFKYDTLVC
jgi:hypothetical protein